MTVTRKLMLLLPIVLVLVLARCGSSEPESATPTDTTPSAQTSSAEPKDEAGADAAAKKATADADQQYGAEAIKTAMREHIAHRTSHGTPGVFEIVDPRTSHRLKLRFVKIHDPVRTLDDGFYFACTEFVAIDDPNKAYDLDFWLQPLNGELRVYQENVHKLPVREENQWTLRPRYNFVDDRINLLR